MYWECEPVKHFWEQITVTLTKLSGKRIPCTPSTMLLNNLDLPYPEKRMVLAGLTAAKKILALRWQPPHTLTHTQWLRTFLDVTGMELSVARMHGASKKTLALWTETYDKINNTLK